MQDLSRIEGKLDGLSQEMNKIRISLSPGIKQDVFFFFKLLVLKI